MKVMMMHFGVHLNAAILKFLVLSTRRKEDITQMIEAKDNEGIPTYAAFRYACNERHIEVLKYILEIAPDQKLKDDMIHLNDDFAFKKSVKIGDCNVMKLSDYSFHDEFFRSIQKDRIQTIKFFLDNIDPQQKEICILIHKLHMVVKGGLYGFQKALMIY
jgi:hypothetical protein